MDKNTISHSIGFKVQNLS